MLGQLINKQKETFLNYIENIKKQDQEILQLVEQEKAIFSSVGTAIIVVEEDMTIEYANTEFETLTGYNKENIEGKMKWAAFFPEEVIDKMIEYHKLRKNIIIFSSKTVRVKAKG